MNILWIIGEDMGPQFGCYGYPLVRTPNLDRLASEGVRFTKAFTTAPVCSAARSAWNTGMYQTTIGAHHHRSHRKDGYTLPQGVDLISRRLGSHGYFTANVREIAPGLKASGKTDFNFTAPDAFEGTHWRERRKDQPFFAQINFQETHKGPAFVEARKQEILTDPVKIPLPPYYPDHPVVRDEFANYLDAMNLLDRKVGTVLKMLDEEGLAANTAVFFFGDNGRCLIRGKQWLYDAGIHIPLLVRWPGVTKPGTIREDPVSSIDIPATALAMAGIALPPNMQGQVMLGPNAKRRDHIFAARDRCDNTVDRIRCIRTSRYKLIRNFMPERPYTQANNYIETQYPTLGVMKKLHAEGKLNDTQALFMQPRKPEYELYDVMADPHEVRNLADAPRHKKTFQELSTKLERWIEESNDQDRMPEADSARQL
jgi:N-sulfoglucosamine sulfohydrolase